MEEDGEFREQGTQDSLLWRVVAISPNAVIRNYTTQQNLLQCHILDLTVTALINTCAA